MAKLIRLSSTFNFKTSLLPFGPFLHRHTYTSCLSPISSYAQSSENNNTKILRNSQCTIFLVKPCGSVDHILFLQLLTRFTLNSFSQLLQWYLDKTKPLLYTYIFEGCSFSHNSVVDCCFLLFHVIATRVMLS